MNIKNIIKDKLEARHVYIITIVMLYIYLIGNCLYQHINGNGFDSCKLELIVIIFMSLAIYLFSFFNMSIFNKKEIKVSFKQIRNNCISDSIFLSLVFTTFLYLLIAYETIYINFYSLIPNQIILSVIGLALLIFIIFFIVSYLITFNIFDTTQPLSVKK